MPKFSHTFSTHKIGLLDVSQERNKDERRELLRNAFRQYEKFQMLQYYDLAQINNRFNYRSRIKRTSL